MPLNSECGRRKLMLIGAREANSRTLDFEFASPSNTNPNSSHYIPLQSQGSYAVNVVVEGHCGWSDRTRLALLLDTAVAKQQSYCGEWFEPAMVPWLHFAPVDYLLDTLERTVEHLLKDGGAAAAGRIGAGERIRRGAREFAKDALERESVEAYVREVLVLYGEAFEEEGGEEEGGGGEGGESAEDYMERWGEKDEMVRFQ